MRDTPAPLAFAGLLLGLSLMGCGETKNSEEGNAESETDPTVTASSEDTGSSSGITGTGSTTQNQETAEASDYAGPEATSDWEETGPEPESSGEDTTGEDSSTTGDDSSCGRCPTSSRTTSRHRAGSDAGVHGRRTIGSRRPRTSNPGSDSRAISSSVNRVHRNS